MVPSPTKPVSLDVDVWSIWRALLAPRRLVPILLLGVPLVLVQGELSSSVWGWPFIVAVVGGLVLLAPVAYLHLLRDDLPVRTLPVRFVAYTSLSAFAPFAIHTLPILIGLPPFVSTSPTVFISAGLFWVAGYGLGRDIYLEHRWLATHRHAQLLATQAEQAQLLALRAHLDPHFLFNTLNAIAEWCREDPTVAERALVDLSGLLRQVLVGVRAPAWPLHRELEAVRRLLALHQIRDPGRFSIDWQVRADDDLVVPPMLLLPIVENAMTHGPGRGHRGAVTVRAATVPNPDGRRARVEIVNPGRFQGRRPGGEGLSTTERRLKLAFGEAGRLDIEAADDTTRVALEWPAEPLGSAEEPPHEEDHDARADR